MYLETEQVHRFLLAWWQGALVDRPALSALPPCRTRPATFVTAAAHTTTISVSAVPRRFASPPPNAGFVTLAFSLFFLLGLCFFLCSRRAAQASAVAAPRGDVAAGKSFRAKQAWTKQAIDRRRKQWRATTKRLETKLKAKRSEHASELKLKQAEIQELQEVKQTIINDQLEANDAYEKQLEAKQAIHEELQEQVEQLQQAVESTTSELSQTQTRLQEAHHQCAEQQELLDQCRLEHIETQSKPEFRPLDPSPDSPEGVGHHIASQQAESSADPVEPDSKPEYIPVDLSPEQQAILDAEADPQQHSPWKPAEPIETPTSRPQAGNGIYSSIYADHPPSPFTGDPLSTRSSNTPPSALNPASADFRPNSGKTRDLNNTQCYYQPHKNGTRFICRKGNQCIGHPTEYFTDGSYYYSDDETDKPHFGGMKDPWGQHSSSVKNNDGKRRQRAHHLGYCRWCLNYYEPNERLLPPEQRRSNGGPGGFGGRRW